MDILNNFQFKTTNYRKYDWHTIFDGQIRKLQKGIDFNIDTKNFKISVINKAKKMNMAVKAEINNDDLIVQAQKLNADK